jgi:NAD(P)-dependent dehydrogenase (short-subunit alcohol dehydrogenase family)
MKTLMDRVAVVTGAASGIGRATAVALAKEGCDLAICDVNQVGLDETAELVRATGRRACTHHVDVSDKARMQRYADEVFAEYGKVHIVVNNAGVTVTAPFADHSLEDFEWIVGINFWGVVYGCKFFLPYLRQQDEAHIVNISSVFGLVGVPLQTSYCATKFAVRGFTEALWVELKSLGIGVTSIHPGGVRTNIAKSARATDAAAKQQGVDLIEKVSITPEKCAGQIVKAIKKNKQRQLVTRETVFVDGIKRLAPVFAQSMLARGYERGVVGGIKPAGK